MRVRTEGEIIYAAKTVYGEARGEPFEGQIAVAWVIRNRAENKCWWGGPDFKSVCLAPAQFSCWNDNDPNRAALMAMSRSMLLGASDAAQSCLTAALCVARDVLPDPTHGATHYVVSTWLDDPRLKPNWAKGLTPLAVIGHHTFFRPGG